MSPQRFICSREGFSKWDCTMGMLQLNVMLPAGACFEEVGHCGHDLEGCIAHLGSSPPSAFWLPWCEHLSSIQDFSPCCWPCKEWHFWQALCLSDQEYERHMEELHTMHLPVHADYSNLLISTPKERQKSIYYFVPPSMFALYIFLSFLG